MFACAVLEMYSGLLTLIFRVAPLGRDEERVCVCVGGGVCGKGEKVLERAHGGVISI